jgi:hypothetical protein
MNRFDIVIGHYAFYTMNHTGQGSEFYRRLSKILTYFTPGCASLDLGSEENEQAREVYNALARKHSAFAWTNL